MNAPINFPLNAVRGPLYRELMPTFIPGGWQP